MDTQIFTHEVKNVSFSLNEHAVEFSFTKPYQNNEAGEACLQLPSTADSQHVIDGVENGDWGCEQTDVFQQLNENYFASFKSADEAAAAALVADYIDHVEEVGDLYVAFCAGADKQYILTGSPYKGYYNKASLFCLADDRYYGEIDIPSITEKAKEQYFSSLAHQLDSEMTELHSSVFRNKNSVLTGAVISDSLQKLLHEFMVSEFEQHSSNYKDNPVAMEFYNGVASNSVVDFERSALEFMGSINQ